MSTQTDSADEGETGRARHVTFDHGDPAHSQQDPSIYRGTAREGWCHHPDCHNHVTQTSATAGARPENSEEYGHDPECPYFIYSDDEK